MVLRYKEIGEIISLIDASACDEFVLETDDVKLVLRRRGAGAGEAASAPAGGGTAAPAAARGEDDAGGHAAAASAAAASQQAASSAPVPADGTGVVSAPMVGTFYRAPSPEEPPFAEVGARVKAGDPLCLIEVMKLFTTVYAEFAGTVREIAAENGQPVEYGQTLFVIEPE